MAALDAGGRGAALQRALLVAVALAAPVLGRAQEAQSAIPSTSAAAPIAPAAGMPAAELPGASLPGLALPVPGLTGAGATGLSPPPADYTRYGVTAGVGASDNVDLSATHHKSQALTAANLFFDLIRSGSRLEMSALGNFSDINYLEHAYRNQVLGRFDGLANLTLWKHHLKWLARDDYGNQQVNALESLTPANLQRVNIFSTGPDLRLQPTLSNYVDLQALYSRSSYQSSPFDGQAEMGSVSVGHQFSPLASISIVGRVERERFNNTTVNSNYQVREYYARYQITGARTAIDLQGGMDQSNDTGSWKSTPLVRVSITRNVSPFSSVSLSGGREYNNAMGSFASLANGASGGIPIGPVTQTTANALHTYGNASWGFNRLRTTLNLFGGWARDSYARQSQYDVTRSNVGLSLGRQLTPRLSASITASAYRTDYANQSFTDNYGTIGAGFIYRPGAWVVITGRYDHQLRRPSGATSTFGYDENRIFVMIGYYPHSSRTGAPGSGGMGEMGGMGGGGLP